MTASSGFTWQDWATITALIGTLLAIIVAVVAYADQRRSMKQTAILAKWADLSADKTLSEGEIKKLTAQRSSMEEEISRKIPGMARNAVLREQVALHESAIAQHVADWQLIQKELSGTTALAGVDSNVQHAIFDRILPRHLRHERRDRIRTRLTVMSVALAVGATMIPAPANEVFVLLVAIPLIYTSARLYALNEEPERAFAVLRPLCHMSYGIAAAAMLAAGVFVVRRVPLRSTTGYGGLTLLVLGALMALGYISIRVWVDRCVRRLCGTDPITWK